MPAGSSIRASADRGPHEGPTPYRATRWPSPGEHTVVMEYYESEGGAVATLHWAHRF
ncbi:hypothetical protein [Hyalangium rubrum]|uniref:Uncharacterized protein n=1 Tax=Hyalangium rubrum TaxID=3103134 RepID=A0ABU5HDV4_9BACT|nr:hypothetical protein [Hyalangium sp. s54d21]MDY7231044.1 hypothetical protein [Hyalangium sp. s54d21]